MIQMEVKGLDDFVKKCKSIYDMYPVMANEFMRAEAKALTQNIKKVTPYSSFKKGYYTKTSKSGKIESWKAIKNKEPHYHLIIDGHEIWIPKKQSNGKYVVYDTGKKTKSKDWVTPVKEVFAKQFDSDLEKLGKGILDGS